MLRKSLIAAIVVAVALPASAIAAGGDQSNAAAPQTKICSSPDKDWERAAPAELGLDAAKLTAALKFADSRLSASAMLIRHGCLAGISPNGQANSWYPQESWSMAKSMVSMTALRAMTMGLLSPDDRLGALMPEADAAHGSITVRQMLEMSTGLHWNLLADYNIWNPDVVRHGLLLPFDDKPGTIFEYHQTSTALMTKVIERAVGEPFQAFVQRELFGPVGIPRSHWSWMQDNVGDTRGFFGLQMPAGDFARLGLLMLRDGAWNSQRLIDPWYVAAAHARSSTNPGYGWMFWRNDPGGYISATVMSRSVKTRPFLPAAPMDAYAMSGLFDQQVVIIPSLDAVYVRMGLPSSDPAVGGLIDLISSSEGPYSLSRKMMAAFVTPTVPDTGPWVPDPELPPATGNERGLATSLQHPEELILAGMSGKPPLPPAGPKRVRVPVTPGGLLAVDERGGASMPVGCPPIAELPCRATFVLTTESGRPLSSTVLAGLPKGGATTLRFRVSAAARKRIQSAPRGQLGARVTIYVGDSVERWISVAVPPITLAMAN